MYMSSNLSLMNDIVLSICICSWMPSQFFWYWRSRRFQISLERSHDAFIFIRHERCGQTLLSSTTSSANTMRIGVDASCGQVKVDNMRNVRAGTKRETKFESGDNKDGQIVMHRIK
jgi:hypothetical protein